MVDDYTRRGLFNHISKHDGRALCAHEEMSAFFDIIQKRQVELNGERQLYCRLYDGGRWTNVTGAVHFILQLPLNIFYLTGYQKQDSKQQLDKVCLCVCGFLQPLPFIQKLYPSLKELRDGFLDRFLICSPRPKLLLEEEVEDWCTKLSQEHLQSLSKVYKLISCWHNTTLPRNYAYSSQAKEEYRLFANEITRVMNSQFIGEGGNTEDNCSKDKRTMIR